MKWEDLSLARKRISIIENNREDFSLSSSTTMGQPNFSNIVKTMYKFIMKFLFRLRDRREKRKKRKNYWFNKE